MVIAITERPRIEIKPQVAAIFRGLRRLAFADQKPQPPTPTIKEVLETARQMQPKAPVPMRTGVSREDAEKVIEDKNKKK